MMLRRAVSASIVSFSLFSAVSAQQPESPPAPALQQHPAVSRPAPPAPLVAPQNPEAAKPANSNAIYEALRARTPSGPSFKVKGFTLRRDAGEFRLSEGTVTLYNEVDGRVTGAVFEGQGVLHLEPPSAMERRQLKLIMKTEVLDQPFTTAVFAFTDDTAKELKAASQGDAAGTNAMGPAGEMQTLCRKDLRYNLEERMLADLVKGQPGGFFMANLKGPMFSKRLLYFVDPEGAFAVAPEEVGLLTSADGSYDITLGFRSAKHGMGGNATFGISQQTIAVEIEKNGKLTGKATALVHSNDDGLRVLPLELYPTLRATGVWNAKGEALEFIQEDKEHDAGFAVVLKRPLARGETAEITTTYGGPDVVMDEGNLNYMLAGGARESWYPNMGGDFGNYAQYRMTFTTAKDVQVVATGDRLRDDADGKMRVSEWQTPVPIPVAGFNLGGFKTQQSEHAGVQLVSYANAEPSDMVHRVSGYIMGGTMSTTGMLKQATAEGDAAVQIYTDFFGPLDFDHLALTQQPQCNYGQSWPMLVYLPVCYFWDSTIQQQLGLLDSDPTYWKVVTPHEVAHQWWGHTVGFNSYRDQWMSEGFADFSASLYLLYTRKDMTDYRDFWALERKRLLEKNAQGVRPVDVGPVVMGVRASSSRAGGGVYQSLIYPKGAYILHMLEMLYWTPQYKEKPFKVAMHDFVNTYRDRSATTEDFKAVMEKNMPPWMDIEHNHKLDWFFNAYVYGTEVPAYTVTSSFETKGDHTIAHFKITQAGVSPGFTMMVPLYIEMGDNNVHAMGHLTMKGSSDSEQTVDLGKMPTTPKRILVNYNYDILSAN